MTPDAGVWYIIIGMTVLGVLAVLVLVAVADEVWAGRRRHPRSGR